VIAALNIVEVDPMEWIQQNH